MCNPGPSSGTGQYACATNRRSIITPLVFSGSTAALIALSANAVIGLQQAE
jgi:hypothetical protein